MAFSITSLYDQQSLTQPLRFGENAVAEGVFSEQQGRVLVGDVEATVQTWTASQIVFVPNGDSRPEGNYAVHVDNIPGVTGPSEYLIDFTLKDIGAWTHTRASNATAPNESGTIITYTTDQPAWYRDQGLQLEDESTNQCRESANMTNGTYWIARGSVIVSSTEPAPDGSNTATHLALFNQSVADIRQASVTVGTPGDPNSPSVWVRSRDNNDFRITNPQGTSRGHWNIDGSLLSPSWERITREHAAVNVVNEFINREDTGGYGIWFQEEFGSATTNIDVWGSQIEWSAFSSSHIPTSIPAETRAATSCEATFAELGAPLPAGGFTNDYCGQIKFVMRNNWGDQPLFYYDMNNGATERLYIRQHSNGTMQVVCTKNNDAVGKTMALTIGSPVNGDVIDVRYKVSSTEGLKCWGYVNGVLADTDAKAGEVSDHASPLVNVPLGMNVNGVNRTSIVLTKVRIRPEALTDAEIEAWD